MVLCMENISYQQDYHFICNQIKWARLCIYIFMFYLEVKQKLLTDSVIILMTLEKPTASSNSCWK